MDKYFSKFPKIIYNGYTCTDISRSARFSQNARNQSSLYYPIEIDPGFRPDLIAEAYYEDPEMDWMVWLANDVIDPYYDWYLSEQQFDAFINEKYGSYENAVKHVKEYRNNWAGLDETITPSHYENNLALELKKYYTPEFGDNLKIFNYRRKEEDWATNTNRIIRYEISTNSLFTVGEIIDIKSGGEIVGAGEVVACNTTSLTIQHVSGFTSANSSDVKQLIGETSGLNVSTSNSTILQINITDDEADFWSPVTWYDYELEKNESRKNMILINSEYVLDVSESLRLKMKE